jgi:hypothetical protein
MKGLGVDNDPGVRRLMSPHLALLPVAILTGKPDEAARLGITAHDCPPRTTPEPATPVPCPALPSTRWHTC